MDSRVIPRTPRILPADLAGNLPKIRGMATKTKTRPYWLDGGTERCELCMDPMHLQAERRCAACDRAVCAHCVEANPETGEVLCSECRAGEAED